VYGACDLYCEPGSECPPCEIGECIPAPQPVCEKAYTANSCAALPGCIWTEVMEGIACPAVCIDDGNGGCKPCDPVTTKVKRCVPDTTDDAR
jgi:hypothetical protein